MHILLTNDDGIFAPGLRALHQELVKLGTVQVVAPALEQSGVGHSITYLHPVMVREIYEHGQLFGHAVYGSPADCVKMGMMQFCHTPPDLVVSGINGGSNVGINVLYSGTVAAAIEGAFFGTTSIAISLNVSEPPDFEATARRAVDLIRQMWESGLPRGSLWNMNFPECRPEWPVGVKLLPMGIERYREIVVKRIDLRGRPYYWSGTDPVGEHPTQAGTDVECIADGYVAITPLHFDLTRRDLLNQFQNAPWKVNQPPEEGA